VDNLQKIIAKKNYYALYESSLICGKAKEVVEKIMGRNATIISFKNGVLKIKSVDNFYDNEIRSHRYNIIEDLNKKIGRPAIKRISIV
jgi:hypothetical protein